MRWSLLLMLVVLLSLSAGRASGQFTNAFDPDVYLPTVGVHGEIDTIYGSRDGQMFGEPLFDPGPNPSNGHSRVLMDSIGILLRGDTIEHSIYEYSPYFDLFNLGVAQTDTFINFSRDIYWGHFRSRAHKELLYAGTEVPIIYWQDANGLYDSSSTTLLIGPTANDGPTGFPPIICPLAGDSTDDLVLFWNRTHDPDSLHSTIYACYYKGDNIYGRDTASPDSISLFQVYHPSDTFPLFSPTFGDFRGTGRTDILSPDYYYNLLLFKNDKPFSLSKLVADLNYDTVLVQRHNLQLGSQAKYNDLPGTLSMRAFPKSSRDKSDDFLMLIHDYSDSAHYNPTHVFMFKGGTNFGTKRLVLDSADFILPTPEVYEPQPTPLYIRAIQDCGDMTGTGNRVLLVTGSVGGPFDGLYFFYVTGRALDSTVDMYYGLSQNGLGGGFPIKADADTLQDMILSMSDFASSDDVLHHNKSSVGTVHVVHGSKKIPVHINQRFDVATTVLAPGELETYPNPATQHTNIVIRGFEGKEVSISIRDVLGRELYHESKRCMTNGEIDRIETSSLAQGTYVISVEGGGKRIVSRIAVIR